MYAQLTEKVIPRADASVTRLFERIKNGKMFSALFPVLRMMFNLSLFSAVHSLHVLVGSSVMMKESSARTALKLLGDVVNGVQVIGQMTWPNEGLITQGARCDLCNSGAMFVLIVVQHVSAISEYFIAKRTRHHILPFLPHLTLVCESTTTGK